MTECSPEDPLHGPSWPHSIWSTTNVGEAIPGVPTPLHQLPHLLGSLIFNSIDPCPPEAGPATGTAHTDQESR